MTDQPAPSAAQPDPAPAPPVVKPSVADLLAAYGTLIRGSMRRFYGVGSSDSIAEVHVLAAIEDGTAFVSQRDAVDQPFAVTGSAVRVVTPATAGTGFAGTEEA